MLGASTLIANGCQARRAPDHLSNPSRAFRTGLESLNGLLMLRVGGKVEGRRKVFLVH